MSLSWWRLGTKNKPFVAMYLSPSRGTCLIELVIRICWEFNPSMLLYCFPSFPSFALQTFLLSSGSSPRLNSFAINIPARGEHFWPLQNLRSKAAIVEWTSNLVQDVNVLCDRCKLARYCDWSYQQCKDVFWGSEVFISHFHNVTISRKWYKVIWHPVRIFTRRYFCLGSGMALRARVIKHVGCADTYLLLLRCIAHDFSLVWPVSQPQG